MKIYKQKRILGLIMSMILVLTNMMSVCAAEVDISNLASESKYEIVLTMGADLTEDQRNNVINYFGIDVSNVREIKITNQDERNMLGNLISEETIGTHTLSCALVNPTNAGGIQVKTANMNYVTSNMIASTLSTSGVYNCEVLTAAPFEVSGTGALTGVMMAYEEASGSALDDTKKELANVELVTTGSIAEEVGQEEATLIVNDIKIRIVRDALTDEAEVYQTVDDVVSITETAAETAAINQGKEVPKKLGEVEHEKLYNFSYQFSQQEYDYAKMQPTLERVTYNVATSSGIDDPITDTFTTITEDLELPSNSILLGTNDEIWGDGAIINATNKNAVSDRPADPINVFTGEVTINPVCGVKADEFINDTNIMVYKDLNGSYALMDLNGNVLTDSVYDKYFESRYGKIIATLNDGSGMQGLLAPDGSVLIDFKYPVIKMVGNMWAFGYNLTAGTEENYDFTDYNNYYLTDTVDVYYIGPDKNALVGNLKRSDCQEQECLSDYINIQAESGVITTYDSSFNMLQTTDSLWNFGAYNEDNSLEDVLTQKTGYYVSSFYGDYAQFYGDNGYGIMDRYGNVIIPANFSSFENMYDRYESGGYFCSINGESVKFITAGGNVTAEYAYGYNSDSVKSVSSYGMTAKVSKEDESYILLSADGIETNLGTEYSYISAIKESKGMLWDATIGNRHDLIDWHGNVLLSDTKSLSLSANGSYLISGDGYTSSTLYMINDAEEVKIAESVGAAQELVVEAKEAGSLEVYSDQVRITEVADSLGEGFVSGTNLMYASNDNTHYALLDVTGKQLTDTLYSHSMEYHNGWIIVSNEDTGKYGVLSAQNGVQVIPCEYDTIDVLAEKWIVAYTLKETTEDDYDFTNWGDGTKYQIDTAKVNYINNDEITSVQLVRDQIKDVAASGDYLNIMDRSTENVNTYDSSFNAIASVNYVDDFSDYSQEYVLERQLEDKTEYSVLDIRDGYAKVVDFNSDKYGILDMNGNVILPVEYDSVDSIYTDDDRQFSYNGYFAVENDDKYGYVTAGGEVSCELKYDNSDMNFNNCGMAATYKNEDGTYLIISADGVESGPYSDYPIGEIGGKIFKVNHSLVDWHGNVLLENYFNCSFSGDGNYILVQPEYLSPYVLYTIDGAEVVGVMGDKLDAGSEREENTEANAVDNTEEVAEDIPETDTEETESAVNETEPASDDNSSYNANSSDSIDASKLLQTVQTLLTVDFETNKTAIAELLKQSKEMLETDNGAAEILDSAITLLDAGVGDANTIQTLISSALELM